jgi:hypothetical protein
MVHRWNVKGMEPRKGGVFQGAKEVARNEQHNLPHAGVHRLQVVDPWIGGLTGRGAESQWLEHR